MRRILTVLVLLALMPALLFGWPAGDCPEGHIESTGEYNVDDYVFGSTTTLINEIYGTAHKGGADQAAANAKVSYYDIYRWWDVDKDGAADSGDEPVGHSHLNGAINNSVTTLTLESTSSFRTPTSARPCFVLINSELLMYTGKTDTTLTGLTRGYNETSADTQGDGSSVTEVGGWELWLHAVTSGAGSGLSSEDFTGYTETDPGNDITVTSTKIDVDELPMNVDSYVYSDEGAGGIGTTFTYQFDVTPQAYRVPGSSEGATVWAVSNTLDDSCYWLTNNSQALRVFLYLADDSPVDDQDYYFTLRDDSTNTTAPLYWGPLVNGTTYYLSVVRNGATITCSMYSDDARTTLLKSNSLSTSPARTYQYLFATCSYNTGHAKWMSFDVENLDAGSGGGVGGYGYDAIGFDADYGLDNGTEGDLLQDDGVDDVPVSEGTAYLFKIHVVDPDGDTNTEVGGVDQLESHGPDCYMDGDGDAGQGIEADEVVNMRVNKKPRRRFR